MAGSLFDQLKKAGLVDEKKAKKAKKEKYQQAKQNKGKKGQPKVSETTQLVQEAAQQKAERDRDLNLKRQQAQEKKADQAAVSQRIEANRLTKYEGNQVYNFVDGSQVKTLNVNAKTYKQLVLGEIRLARFKGGYALVLSEVADKIEQVNAQMLIPLSSSEEKEGAEKGMSAEDKAYYDQFEIPDDLVW